MADYKSTDVDHSPAQGWMGIPKAGRPLCPLCKSHLCPGCPVVILIHRNGNDGKPDTITGG